MVNIEDYHVTTAKLIEHDSGEWQKRYMNKIIFVSHGPSVFTGYYNAWDFETERFLGKVLKRRLNFMQFGVRNKKVKRWSIRTIRSL